MHPVCVVMLAALPLAVLAGSPQRVGLSAVIAATYMVAAVITSRGRRIDRVLVAYAGLVAAWMALSWLRTTFLDRKSTRLNSSHSQISYAVFCLKKKKKNNAS